MIIHLNFFRSFHIWIAAPCSASFVFWSWGLRTRPVKSSGWLRAQAAYWTCSQWAWILLFGAWPSASTVRRHPSAWTLLVKWSNIQGWNLVPHWSESLRKALRDKSQTHGQDIPNPPRSYCHVLLCPRFWVCTTRAHTHSVHAHTRTRRGHEWNWELRGMHLYGDKARVMGCKWYGKGGGGV